MDERIMEHLQRLNKYFLMLKEAQKIPLEEFIKDEVVRASSERFLQLAIESCLNIGNRLISLYQFEKPVEPPETYADIFVQMMRLGVFDKQFCDRLIKMARFRNRLVHLYWELDEKTIYNIIQEDLEDFRVFQDKVVSFLNRQETGRGR